MKRIYLAIAALAVGFLVACGAMTQTNPDGSPLTPNQQAIGAATTSYKALDAAIVSADEAVKKGTLKGADARRVLDAFTKAQEGLNVGLVALRNANAAAAAEAAASAASGVKP
jgi:hypothetical protein